MGYDEYGPKKGMLFNNAVQIWLRQKIQGERINRNDMNQAEIENIHQWLINIESRCDDQFMELVRKAQDVANEAYKSKEVKKENVRHI